MAKRSGKLPLKKAPCTFDQETLVKTDAILKGNRGWPARVYRAILEAFPGRKPLLYERFLEAYREGITSQDFLEALFSPAVIKEHRPPKAEKRHRAGQEAAPGGKSPPAKKPSPSLPAQAVVSNAASPRASRAKKSTEPIPADWKQDLEQSIEDDPHHPKKQIMLDLLRKKKVEEAANLIWKASRKVNLEWDASLFLGHLQEVLSHLAMSFGLRHLTRKDFRTMAEALEMIRDNELFFRKGPAREELERAIPVLCRLAENASGTKPRYPGQRQALPFLRQYFLDYLQKPLDRATGLLMGATFGGQWNESIVRVRAFEWAECRDDYGLEKATADNTTEEAFAALDKLNVLEREAALEKMSSGWWKLYLGK